MTLADTPAFSAASGPPPQFTGKIRDNETGNDYFGARYYASSTGRFMSPDWSAHAEPVPYAKMDDPQSLNLYAYARNSPIDRSDPDGHVPFSFGGFEDSETQLNFQHAFGSVFLARAQYIEAAQQQLSGAGLKFIAKHEGFSSSVYPDTSENPTIGYGHLLKKGEDFSKGISTGQGLRLLGKDVKSAVSFVNKNLKVGQMQNQFDALVDLSYNSPRGGGIMIRAINSYNGGPPEIGPNPFIPERGDFIDTLPKQWSSIQGLINRRTDEANLYSSGTY